MRVAIAPFLLRNAQHFGKPVCRLGLASRGNSKLSPDDLLAALDQGINFLNWPAESEGAAPPDAMARAIASLGSRRESIVVCIQLAARTAEEAKRELGSALATMATDYVDVVTLYYVEQPDEWHALQQPGGALAWCQEAKANRMIRRLGITTHQRSLAAQAASSGSIDTLMIRYNAAHRGAEQEVFPTTRQHGVAVIAYTALRSGRSIALDAR